MCMFVLPVSLVARWC